MCIYMHAYIYICVYILGCEAPYLFTLLASGLLFYDHEAQQVCSFPQGVLNSLAHLVGIKRAGAFYSLVIQDWKGNEGPWWKGWDGKLDIEDLATSAMETWLSSTCRLAIDLCLPFYSHFFEGAKTRTFRKGFRSQRSHCRLHKLGGPYMRAPGRRGSDASPGDVSAAVQPGRV